MLLLHEGALYLHIGTGALALLLFWAPMLTRKGSALHRQSGRWFARIMYTVAVTGLLMSGLDLWQPALAHPPGTSADPAAHSAGIRRTALFLFSLSILVLATTRHGWLTINAREQRQLLRTPVHQALLLLLLLAGLLLLWQGLRNTQVLLLVFGVLQIWLAVGFLHYSRKTTLTHAKEWWTEHLGAMIASGIGAYTAFFVVGGARVFEPWLADLYSGSGIILWVAPGVVGGVLIGVQTARYRRRFSGKSG